MPRQNKYSLKYMNIYIIIASNTSFNTTFQVTNILSTIKKEKKNNKKRKSEKFTSARKFNKRFALGTGGMCHRISEIKAKFESAHIIIFKCESNYLNW